MLWAQVNTKQGESRSASNIIEISRGGWIISVKPDTNNVFLSDVLKAVELCF